MFRRQLIPCTFLLLPLVLMACSSKHEPDPRTEAPLVRVAPVHGASTPSRSFTGTVAAQIQSDLGFRVSGKVQERLVDTGQRVKRGQALMRIDPIDLNLQAHAHQEAVAVARARAKQATDDEARYRGLVDAGAVSASAYDQIKASADSAQAQLKAAEAQANVAQNASRYALLLADADGTVVETLAEPGQVVSAGQPVVRLAQDGQRDAVVHLPETLRPPIGSTAKATLYGNRQTPVLARLRQLSDAADQTSRTYEAKYTLTGPSAQAPLGATVTVEITDVIDATSSLTVPISALFDPGNGPGIWIVEGKPARVAWHPVRVMSLTDEEAQIQGDVRISDSVVSLGAHLLHEGDTVRPMDQSDSMATGEHP